MKRTFINVREGKLEVLLVKHAEGISKGKWGLPGGWIKRKKVLMRQRTGYCES